MDYCIIIPAHNEEEFIGNTLNSVLRQTLAPKEIIVVNDNSTDTTEAIIDTYIRQVNYLSKITITSSSEHMPGSKVVNAFNTGLHKLTHSYDFLVKLDADIILPDNYFEEIATIFKSNSKIGIAGGFAYEQNDKKIWLLNHPMNKNHVRGAFKAYSSSCFKAIGGLKNAMGWDTLDELLAQFHGFEIMTIDSLKAKHLRPLGKAYNKKAKLLQGEAMYRMRYGFWIMVIASLKMALKQQKPKAFIDNISGYFKARKEQKEFLTSIEEGVFIRQLRWKNMKQKLF